jgi:hypothetical protein
MEPSREQPKAPKPPTEDKPKRFRIVKLEERIAPGWVGTKNHSRCVTCSPCSGMTTCTGPG